MNIQSKHGDGAASGSVSFLSGSFFLFTRPASSSCLIPHCLCGSDYSSVINWFFNVFCSSSAPARSREVPCILSSNSGCKDLGGRAGLSSTWGSSCAGNAQSLFPFGILHRDVLKLVTASDFISMAAINKIFPGSLASVGVWGTGSLAGRVWSSWVPQGWVSEHSLPESCLHHQHLPASREFPKFCAL